MSSVAASCRLRDRILSRIPGEIRSWLRPSPVLIHSRSSPINSTISSREAPISSCAFSTTSRRAVCTFDGKKVINLASNNYLGLTTHPKLREAALEATKKYGVGSGAVRTIAGTMKIHMELEEKIARFKNVEACVVFQSGFTANAGTVSAILGKEDFIISDELNHASIIDGAASRAPRSKSSATRTPRTPKSSWNRSRTSPATSC